MNTILTIMQWIKVNVRVLFVLTLVCGVVLYTLELWTEGGLRFRASQPASTRDFHPPAANSLRFIPQHRLPDAKRSRNNSVVVHIPAMVHQTLKQKAQKGSTDQTRWSTQCQQVNSALDFYLYDDEELANFVRNHYLQYNSLYQSLSGICK